MRKVRVAWVGVALAAASSFTAPSGALEPLDVRPEIEFSTFLGGRFTEYFADLAVDPDGNIYVLMTTWSDDLPVVGGTGFSDAECEHDYDDCSDAYVAKIAPNGTSIIYSTYLGGTMSDFPAEVVVDDEGNAFIGGTTFSFDYPVTEGVYQPERIHGETGFITKIDPDGDLVYSTYLGRGNSYILGIDIDEKGRVFAVGETDSPRFPTTAGAWDRKCETEFDQGKVCDFEEGFVAKLSASGSSLLYSTVLDGGRGSYATGVEVDEAGHAFVVGTTWAGFPTTAGAFDETADPWGRDGFLLKLAPSGSGPVYSTVLSGDDDDWASEIDIGPTGRAYVVGGTNSPDFPTTVDSFDPTCRRATRGCNSTAHGYVLSLNAAGSELHYSSYVAGDEWDLEDRVVDIDALPDGSALVVGIASSPDFPLVRSLKQRTSPCQPNQCYDALLLRVDPDGRTLDLASFIGGKRVDNAAGVSASPNGRIVIAGTTQSEDFPTENARQGAFGGNGDAYVMRLHDPFETVTHRRAISFRLRDHLRAGGSLRTIDGYAGCASGVPVSIRRGQYEPQQPIARAQTGPRGGFAKLIPDANGTYAVRVPESVRSGQNGTVHVCQRVWSRWRTHWDEPTAEAKDARGAPSSGAEDDRLLLHEARRRLSASSARET